MMMKMVKLIEQENLSSEEVKEIVKKKKRRDPFERIKNDIRRVKRIKDKKRVKKGLQEIKKFIDELINAID